MMPKHQNVTTRPCGRVCRVPRVRDVANPPDTKNATPVSCSSCLGGFSHPRHGNATPVSCFHVWCGGTPFHHPPPPQTRKTRPCGRVFHFWGVSLPFPPLSTAWGVFLPSP